jgi:hypothetical protein
MLDFLRTYWLAIRRWPVYTGLLLLLLLGFGWAGQGGTRLFGDDNESTENANGGPGNSLTGHGGSHGGHGTFYHK